MCECFSNRVGGKFIKSRRIVGRKHLLEVSRPETRVWAKGKEKRSTTYVRRISDEISKIRFADLKSQTKTIVMDLFLALLLACPSLGEFNCFENFSLSISLPQFKSHRCVIKMTKSRATACGRLFLSSKAGNNLREFWKRAITIKLKEYYGEFNLVYLYVSINPLGVCQCSPYSTTLTFYDSSRLFHFFTARPFTSLLSL